MAHASGSALYMRFIHSGGTVVASGNQRAVSWDDSLDLAETTAGADSDKSYIPTLRDGTGSIDLVDDGTAGSALYQAFYVGNAGTLEWGTHGTATGSPKYSCPIIINSGSRSAEYATEMMRTYGWQKNGAWITNFDILGSTW